MSRVAAKLDYTVLTIALVRHYVTPFKGRHVRMHEAVEVYRNLNCRSHRYSLRQGGRVVGHANAIMLRDATFHVNRAGWERMRRTGCRNVHAVVRGRITPSGMGTIAEEARLPKIRYDDETGKFRWEQHALKSAMIVAFNERGACGAYFETET